MPDFAATRAHLAKSGCSKIAAIHRHNRRTFCAAVAFQWTNSERIFECESDAFGQFLCTYQNKLQTAKAFRRATPHVGLKESGCGDEEGDSVLLDKVADDLRIQRVWMVDHADSVGRRHPQRGHETEGVEEGKNAEDLVMSIEHEYLRHLLNIGHDVVVRQHDAFGIARAAAGEDYGCQLIDNESFVAAGFGSDGRSERRVICA